MFSLMFAAVEQHRVGAVLALDRCRCRRPDPTGTTSSPAPSRRGVVALVAVDEVVAVAAEQDVGAVAAEQACRCRCRRRP